MSRFHVAGWISIVGGLLLFFWQVFMSTMGGEEVVWKTVCLADLLGAGFRDWLPGFSPLEYAVEMPLCLLLVTGGVILMVVGRIARKLLQA